MSLRLEDQRFELLDVTLRREDRVTPQNSANDEATDSWAVAAKTGADGRSADSRRAVFPSRVTATIASACPVVASVTADSQSARLCSRPGGSISGTKRATSGTDSASRITRSSVSTASNRVQAGGGFPREHDRVDALRPPPWRRR